MSALAPAPGAVESAVVEVDGVPISALVSAVEKPRAVVLALHGGAVSAAYWDAPGHPRLSLLRLGAALGYTVIALDRPGYGASQPFARSLADPQRRVDLAYAAAAALAPEPGAGTFLVSHSIGGELAVRMAADERGRDLLGLELSGTGRAYHPVTAQVLEGYVEAARQMKPELKRGGIGRRIWDPPEVYPDELAGGRAVAADTPLYEALVIGSWTTDFAAVAAGITIPVQFSLGELEAVWASGPEAMADVAALFTSSPRVLTHVQAGAGHNLSVGRTAAAYHLRVLAFAEECIQMSNGMEKR